jgi:hypothetical protein
MAKKTQERVLERLLRKFIPPVNIGVESPNTFTTSGGGWEIVAATDADDDPTYWAVYRDYFDLSGIVEKQETLFTVNPMFQEGCDWNFITEDPLGALQVWDMLTQEYITDATFDGVIPASGNWIPPGMSGGTNVPPLIRIGAPYELEDVHYGNARSFQYGPLTSAGAGFSQFLPNQTRSSSWGVGSATAGQKLYITRAIHISSALHDEPPGPAGATNQIRSPATAIVVPALIAKETDLRYIERLRRSYVVQGTVD